MRGITHLFVAFQLRKDSHHHDGVGLRSSLTFNPGSPFSAPQSNQKSDFEKKLGDLIQAVTEIGPVGSLASKKDQQRVQDFADAMIPYSLPKPALYPLKGEFRLLYSSSSGSSSGRLFGTPVSGKVKQIILDDTFFRNHVKLGPLEMTMQAKREVKSPKSLEITLLEATVNLFGVKLLAKDFSGNDSGMWEIKFVGKMKGEDGKDKLIRIMQAPNLFILEQSLE